MGTGSLSSGALLLGMRGLSVALFAVAALAFALLCALAAVRVVRHPALIRADARDPGTAFAPFTFVAALAVLGTRADLDGHTAWASVAVGLGIAGSLALAVPSLRMLRSRAGHLVTGTWLLPSVAVEALALLAAALGLRLRSNGYEAVAVAMWLLGIPAYLVVIKAIVGQLRRLPVRGAGLTPDYWTVLGVPSLIGLAAARLSAAQDLSAASWLHAVYEPAAFAGLTVSAVLAPAWIRLQARRLMRDPSSRRYSPAWWGLVFPTAIVSANAEVISETLRVPWLHPAAVVGFWCVLAAWAVLMLGLVRNLLHRSAPEARPAPS